MYTHIHMCVRVRKKNVIVGDDFMKACTRTVKVTKHCVVIRVAHE